MNKPITCILNYTKKVQLLPSVKTFSESNNALERMVRTCKDARAGMVYTDYFEEKRCEMKPSPVIEYQEGSRRDDFNFGSLLLYKNFSVEKGG